MKILKEITLINNMLAKQVDGILFIGGTVSDVHKEEYEKAGVPIVLATTYDEAKTIPSVNINYEQAAFDAVDYLIKKGHKSVAFVNGPIENNIISLSKLNGYLRALQENGIEFDENLLTYGDHSYESGSEAFETFHERNIIPSAIFVASDEMAIGVIHSAQDHGLLIPNNLEVIGFDNTRLALMVRPKLTTVVQPMYDIGAVAMRLLTKYMNKETVEDSNVILPHHLQIRQSTK